MAHVRMCSHTKARDKSLSYLEPDWASSESALLWFPLGARGSIVSSSMLRQTYGYSTPEDTANRVPCSVPSTSMANVRAHGASWCEALWWATWDVAPQSCTPETATPPATWT